MRNFYPLLFLLCLLSCQKISEKGDFDQAQQNPAVFGSALNSNSQGTQNLPTPEFRTGIGNSHLEITTQNKQTPRGTQSLCLGQTP